MAPAPVCPEAEASGAGSVGEIVPQALCSRYGLQIGSYSAWFVRGLIWTTWIIAYPISLILDAALGTEHGVSALCWMGPVAA